MLAAFALVMLGPAWATWRNAEGREPVPPEGPRWPAGFLQRRLGRGFAVLVTAAAAYLLVSSAFLGGPPAS